MIVVLCIMHISRSPGKQTLKAGHFGHNSPNEFLRAGHANAIGQRREIQLRSLIDTARAEPVTVEKHGRAVVVVLAVEECERLKTIELEQHAKAVGSGDKK
jgi:hypothetical protein